MKEPISVGLIAGAIAVTAGGGVSIVADGATSPGSLAGPIVIFLKIRGNTMPYSAVLSRRGSPARDHWSIIPLTFSAAQGGHHGAMSWEIFGYGPYDTIEEALSRIPEDQRQVVLEQLSSESALTPS